MCRVVCACAKIMIITISFLWCKRLIIIYYRSEGILLNTLNQAPEKQPFHAEGVEIKDEKVSKPSIELIQIKSTRTDIKDSKDAQPMDDVKMKINPLNPPTSHASSNTDELQISSSDTIEGTVSVVHPDTIASSDVIDGTEPTANTNNHTNESILPPNELSSSDSKVNASQVDQSPYLASSVVQVEPVFPVHGVADVFPNINVPLVDVVPQPPAVANDDTVRVNVDKGKKKPTVAKKWPNYCKKVGHVLALLISLSSMFFVLLYGLKFDLAKAADANNALLGPSNNINGTSSSEIAAWNVDWSVSGRWLFSSFAANLSDVFISRPIVICLLSYLSLLTCFRYMKDHCGACFEHV